MIRSIFYGLSVIFFSLAILITYKAANNPEDHSSTISLPSEFTLAPAPAYPPSAPSAPFSDIVNNETPLLNHASTPNIIEEAGTAAPQHENQPHVLEEVSQNASDNKPRSPSRTLIVFSGKTFRSGQDVIQDVAYSTIENLIKEINASPGSLILIEGHTDNIPSGESDSDNLEVSARALRHRQ